jgi:hypothetical protein
MNGEEVMTKGETCIDSTIGQDFPVMWRWFQAVWSISR